MRVLLLLKKFSNHDKTNTQCLTLKFYVLNKPPVCMLLRYIWFVYWGAILWCFLRISFEEKNLVLFDTLELFMVSFGTMCYLKVSLGNISYFLLYCFGKFYAIILVLCYFFKFHQFVVVSIVFAIPLDLCLNWLFTQPILSVQARGGVIQRQKTQKLFR